MKLTMAGDFLKTTLKEDDWLLQVCINLEHNGMLQDDEKDTVETILDVMLVQENMITLDLYNSLIELLHNRGMHCPLKSMTKVVKSRFYDGPGSGAFYPMKWNTMSLTQQEESKKKRMTKRRKSFDKYVALYHSILKKAAPLPQPKLKLIPGGKK